MRTSTAKKLVTATAGVFLVAGLAACDDNGTADDPMDDPAVEDPADDPADDGLDDTEDDGLDDTEDDADE
ncbi:hypothetical protein [Bogoriella caseilytica]|uniref:DNA primase n=1 Tax=Bogoriella caseilytica TaxID=56055 RepID=A0A3N2BD71_9MICO|nr:hypothetical protein [Bogoriella caseilytica]ROR73175.1 hypothetical protein EDD31_1542 [Bogoriella caseilytica]